MFIPLARRSLGEGGSLRGRVEASRINLGVDPVAIESGFLGRLRSGGAPNAEGQLQAVDIAVVGEVEALLGGRLGSGRRTTGARGDRRAGRRTTCRGTSR